MVAALGPEMLAVTEIDQGIEAVGAFGDHMAAAAAVAAVRTALRDELLAAERDAAVAAVAGADEYPGLVEKFHRGEVRCGAARGKAEISRHIRPSRSTCAAGAPEGMAAPRFLRQRADGVRSENPRQRRASVTSVPE